MASERDLVGLRAVLVIGGFRKGSGGPAGRPADPGRPPLSCRKTKGATGPASSAKKRAQDSRRAHTRETRWARWKKGGIYPEKRLEWQKTKGRGGNMPPKIFFAREKQNVWSFILFATSIKRIYIIYILKD